MNTAETEFERIDRYPDGNVPASRKYIDYGGQLVTRTRFATIQRWTKAGAYAGDRRVARYMLYSDYCTGKESETLDPKNDHLDANQFEIYYVETGERVYYEVENGE